MGHTWCVLGEHALTEGAWSGQPSELRLNPVPHLVYLWPMPACPSLYTQGGSAPRARCCGRDKAWTHVGRRVTIDGGGKDWAEGAPAWARSEGSLGTRPGPAPWRRQEGPGLGREAGVGHGRENLTACPPLTGQAGGQNGFQPGGTGPVHTAAPRLGSCPPWGKAAQGAPGESGQHANAGKILMTGRQTIDAGTPGRK